MVGFGKEGSKKLGFEWSDLRLRIVAEVIFRQEDQDMADGARVKHDQESDTGRERTRNVRVTIGGSQRSPLQKSSVMDKEVCAFLSARDACKMGI